jgi:outer membrane lipoprotein LolB
MKPHIIVNIYGYRLANALPRRRLVKVCFVACLFSFINGCATKPSLENQIAVAVDNNLAQLTQWRLKGKIAWITPQQRTSAYMNWHQNDAQMQFTLTNVLGITLASLSYDGENAILQADGRQFQDPSPSALIYRTTGWQVPLTSLSSWIKGAPSHKGRIDEKNKLSGIRNNAQILRYENGLIKQIKPACAVKLNVENCNEWTIDYTRYTSVSISNVQYQLPSTINMYNTASRASIKMRISEWSQ